MAIYPKKIASFTIVYTQKLKKDQFRYITTTTRRWRRPISEARFSVILSEDILPRFNYNVVREKVVDNRHYYIIEYKKFYPEEDLIIEW
jgi:hypothetical protein